VSVEFLMIYCRVSTLKIALSRLHNGNSSADMDLKFMVPV
jgi:hypothetical protein